MVDPKHPQVVETIGGRVIFLKCLVACLSAQSHHLFMVNVLSLAYGLHELSWRGKKNDPLEGYIHRSVVEMTNHGGSAVPSRKVDRKGYRRPFDT